MSPLKLSQALFIAVYGLLVIFTFGAACTHATPFVVTEEALRVSADEFDAIGTYMNSAMREGRVSPEEYRRWAHFGKQFKAEFDLAVSLYKGALAVEDGATVAKVSEVIAGLSKSLAEFYATMKPAVSVIGTAVPADGGVQ